MRTVRCVGLVALLALAPVGSLHAQVATGTTPQDSVKVALIHQLLARTHAVDQAVTTMEASIAVQKAANPRIPAVFWDRFLAEARAHQDDLAGEITTVYERHFSADELRQLLAFYDTPFGQKLISAMPAVMQESMVAGQAWGRQLGASVGAQLQAEGVRIAP